MGGSADVHHAVLVLRECAELVIHHAVQVHQPVLRVMELTQSIGQHDLKLLGKRSSVVKNAL
jgi:hypothetical protein